MVAVMMRITKMAKRTTCDVCGQEIPDGENAGIRTPVFTKDFGGVQVEVKLSAKVCGRTDSDICIPCLKRSVAEA